MHFRALTSPQEALEGAARLPDRRRSNDMLRQLAITHEGLHGDGTGVSPALRGDLPIGPWNEAHQIPFNEASKELLDP